jgi:hypothetical protein
MDSLLITAVEEEIISLSMNYPSSLHTTYNLFQKHPNEPLLCLNEDYK